ncbi:MAG: universal stress protein [Pseudomonadales bacterium]|nr:universal stress protein [Pseudomonadales bacterium]
MASYKKILLALDFHFDNDQIIEKGAQLARDNDAALLLLHVHEPLSMTCAVESMSFSDQIADLDSGLRQDSANRMVAAGLRLEVPEALQLIRQGRPASEIHTVVKQYDVDLIVMGTHGQSGLQLLLGSTANSVLHGVSCDVLAVRIKG